MFRVNKKLYYYEIFFERILNLYSTNLLPSVILFTGKEGLGKKNFITHFLHKITSENIILNQKNKPFTEDTQKFLNKLVNNNNPNVRYVFKNNENMSISIEQIRDVITYTNKSAFNDEPRYIIISNPEYLNINAANAFLKVLENPPKNTFFFLITDNENNILKTIISRCVKFKINFNNTENKEILDNLLIDFNMSSQDSSIFINKFETAGYILNKIIFLKDNKIDKFSLIDAIIFCLDKFKIKKDYIYLKYALDFSNIFFYNKITLDFKKIQKKYDLFLYKFSNCIKYNTSFDPLKKILNNSN